MELVLNKKRFSKLNPTFSFSWAFTHKTPEAHIKWVDMRYTLL